MNRYYILKRASFIHNEFLKNIKFKSSILSLMKTLLRTIYLEDVSDEVKLQKFNKLIARVKNGKLENLGANKRWEIEKTFNIVFRLDIKEVETDESSLSDLNFNDLYLYFCYIDRLIENRK